MLVNPGRGPARARSGSADLANRRPAAEEGDPRSEKRESDEGEEEDEEEDVIAFDELNEEEKVIILQHLYQEYQKNPDAFPEDQRLLLENELKELFAKEGAQEQEQHHESPQFVDVREDLVP